MTRVPTPDRESKIDPNAIDPDFIFDIIEAIRDLRARYSKRRTNTDVVYHYFSHAVHDLSRAYENLEVTNEGKDGTTQSALPGT